MVHVRNVCADVEPIKIRRRPAGVCMHLLYQYSVTRTDEIGVRISLNFKRGISLLKVA